MLVSCKENDNLPDNEDNSFNLEGSWYISERPRNYDFESETNRFTYDEHVLGYEEYTFTRIESKDNQYSVSAKIRNLTQKLNESDNDYLYRLNSGIYEKSELKDGFFTCAPWLISGNDIYIPDWYLSSLPNNENVLFFKFIKKSKDQFVIMSATPSIDYIYEESPMEYKYKITFTRIK
jgi:hypothetical protein